GVAAGLFLGGTGSDTGGSIRGPAAFCGIAGFKPTYGLCSRRGVLPLSFTLDHTGPMAWTAQDCAMLLQALAGYDPPDRARPAPPTPPPPPTGQCPISPPPCPRAPRAPAWAACANPMRPTPALIPPCSGRSRTPSPSSAPRAQKSATWRCRRSTSTAPPA